MQWQNQTGTKQTAPHWVDYNDYVLKKYYDW